LGSRGPRQVPHHFTDRWGCDPGPPCRHRRRFCVESWRTRDRLRTDANVWSIGQSFGLGRDHSLRTIVRNSWLFAAVWRQRESRRSLCEQPVGDRDPSGSMESARLLHET
jgi:hypothetical protein